MHTLPSITFGLKRYSLPFSAVNSAIAQPLLLTFTPSVDIATLFSFAVSVISGLSLYAPILSFMRSTSSATELALTTAARSRVFCVPFLSVTCSTLASVMVASTLSAPSVAVLQFLIAVSTSPTLVVKLCSLVCSAETRESSFVSLSFSALTRLCSAATREVSVSTRDFSAICLLSSSNIVLSSLFLSSALISPVVPVVAGLTYDVASSPFIFVATIFSTSPTILVLIEVTLFASSDAVFTLTSLLRLSTSSAFAFFDNSDLTVSKLFSTATPLSPANAVSLVSPKARLALISTRLLPLHRYVFPVVVST